ncbi:transcriptional regulator, partial [Oenococcus oeni]
KILVSNITRLVSLKGWTMDQLAEKTGMKSGKQFYAWKDHEPGIDKVTATADALNVSTDYLLGRNKSNNLTDEQLTVAMDAPAHLSKENQQKAIDFMNYLVAQEEKKDESDRKD